jgi:transcriptional regulator with XRE-family HTH domain
MADPPKPNSVKPEDHAPEVRKDLPRGLPEELAWLPDHVRMRQRQQRRRLDEHDPRLLLDLARRELERSGREERMQATIQEQASVINGLSMTKEKAEKVAERSKLRQEWVNEKLAGRPRKVISDHPSGPSRNTLSRYESGQESNQDGSVRGQLAQVFNCAVADVPL